MYSDRNQQVDYSVTFEREVGTAEKNPTYVAGLEALDTKVSMVVASTVKMAIFPIFSLLSSRCSAAVQIASISV